MKFLKNVNLKILKKSLLGMLLFIILLYTGIFIYSYIFEQDKIAIDKYNFEQLEKAKTILDNLPKNSKFYGLDEFNRLYDANIIPIKNCYYVGVNNGDEPYGFGFKLESLIYIYIYRTRYFMYPSYNLPVYNICTGGNRCDYDSTKARFEITISKPCNK